MDTVLLILDGVNNIDRLPGAVRVINVGVINYIDMILKYC